MIRLPGSHVPNIKNRSSKHLFCLTKIKPILRCVNNELLTKMANNNISGAHNEIARRQKKRAKKEVK